MSTTVTGNIRNLATSSVTSGAFVRFWLRGTRGNQPRITGTGAIAPQFNGSSWYVDLQADGSGNVSGTIYSTRDSAGTGDGDIEVGGSKQAVWYGMQVYADNVPGPEVAVHAKNSSTLDISSVTPISTPPVVSAPTGDGTYLRIDARNSPVTGLVQFNAKERVVDGTSSSQLTGQDGSQSGIFITKYDNTSAYTGNGAGKFPFANPVAGSGIRADVFPGSSNTDRVFSVVGHVTSGTVVSNPNGLSASDDKVGGYFAAHRFPDGTAAVTGVNALAEGDNSKPVFGIESDINMTADAPWPFTATTFDGVRAASGGTSHPRFGLSVGSTSSANTFRVGAFIGGWDKEGIEVQYPTGASGTIGLQLDTITPNATSTSDQKNSLDLAFQDSRWNGSAAVNDLYLLRLVPNSSGTDSRLSVLNASSQEVFQVYGAAGANVLIIGQSGLPIQASGKTAFINWAAPGIRMTPTDDTAGTAIQITNAANNATNLALSKAGLVGTYNAIGTVSNGVPSEYATVDLTTQGAAISATTLYAVPAAGAGMYRISYVAAITRAGSVSSTLGGANGFQVSYTDPADSAVKTSPAGPNSAANTTATMVSGTVIVYAKASTNIQYQFGYTDGGGTTMQYDLHVKCEAL